MSCDISGHIRNNSGCHVTAGTVFPRFDGLWIVVKLNPSQVKSVVIHFCKLIASRKDIHNRSRKQAGQQVESAGKAQEQTRAR